MSVFWNLAYYEMKKSLMRKSSAVTVFLVLLISVVSIFGTILSGVYSENGEYIRSGYDDMKLDREYARELSGREIDTPLMMEAAKSYSHIDLNGYSRYTSTFEYEQYARKYSSIYGFIRMIYNSPPASLTSALSRI